MDNIIGKKVKLINIETVTPFDNEDINVGDIGTVISISSKSYDWSCPIEVLFKNREIMWCSSNELEVLN